MVSDRRGHLLQHDTQRFHQEHSSHTKSQTRGRIVDGYGILRPVLISINFSEGARASLQYSAFRFLPKTGFLQSCVQTSPSCGQTTLRMEDGIL